MALNGFAYKLYTTSIQHMFQSTVSSSVGSIVVTDAIAPFGLSTGTTHPLQLTSYASGAVREVAFVDGGLSDAQTLINGVKPGTAVYVLDPSGNELDQISQVLAGYQNLSAVSLFSHGSDGALQLGSTRLNTANLLDYAGLLQSWSNALSADADLLLYGCDVAADATGQNFVSQLAALTGADVAASTDLTGSSALGGNWNLEFSTGTIEASDILSDGAKATYQNVLATLTVNSLADTNDNTWGNGIDTLREAISYATAGDVITFGGNVFTDNLSDTILLTGGELVIGKNLTITGSGADPITISGGGSTRVFNIVSGANTTLDRLTISGGFNDFQGGGILNNGELVVRNSTIIGNAGSFRGGGILNNGGTLTLVNSTVAANSASYGGGIHQITGGSIDIQNSTIASNTAFAWGGGIRLDAGSLTITNSIVATNPNGDLTRESDAAVQSLGYNLIGSTAARFSFEQVTFAPTDLLNINPNLDSLKNNGGNTQTFALLLGSPAINAGDPNYAGSLTTDQRGTGFARISGVRIDIGAFEFVNRPPIVANPLANQSSSEDTVVNFTIPASTFSDVDNDTLILSATLADNTALPGWLTFNATTGNFSGTPPLNFNGTLALKVTASDGQYSTSSPFNLVITEVNDAPVAVNDSLSAIAVNSGVRTISFASLLGNDSKGPANENTQILTITGVSNVIGGTAVISGTSILFTPTPNYNGPASFTYTVQDNGTTNGLADPKTATATASFSVIRNVGTLGTPAVTFTGTVSNSDPVDYYQFTLGSDTNKFRLTLGNLTANADVKVYQLNDDGTYKLDASGNRILAFTYTNRTGTQAEVINNQRLLKGKYLIEVLWAEPLPGSTAYDLSFNA